MRQTNDSEGIRWHITASIYVAPLSDSKVSFACHRCSATVRAAEAETPVAEFSRLAFDELRRHVPGLGPTPLHLHISATEAVLSAPTLLIATARQPCEALLTPLPERLELHLRLGLAGNDFAPLGLDAILKRQVVADQPQYWSLRPFSAGSSADLL